ncbi:MAG: hypothetical protein QM743_02150 [Chitinophagaceae bacterium]
MKKVIFAIAALGLISLTSCKKEYTCSCTAAGQTTDVKTEKKVKKSEAEDMCSALSAQYAILGGSCALK